MAAKPKAVPDKSPVQRFRLEGVEYTFDWSKFMSSEARFVQRTLDLTAKQWMDGLAAENADCIAAWVALTMRRANPEAHDLKTLDLDDFDFDFGTFEMVAESVDPTKEEPGSSSSSPQAVA